MIVPKSYSLRNHSTAKYPQTGKPQQYSLSRTFKLFLIKEPLLTAYFPPGSKDLHFSRVLTAVLFLGRSRCWIASNDVLVGAFKAATGDKVLRLCWIWTASKSSFPDWQIFTVLELALCSTGSPSSLAARRVSECWHVGAGTPVVITLKKPRKWYRTHFLLAYALELKQNWLFFGAVLKRGNYYFTVRGRVIL